MFYNIEFSNISFKPDPKQVIYVENEYNETYNSYIQKNYDELVRVFKSVNLKFVYLPKYTEELRHNKSVLYYAPYIAGNDNVLTLPSNFLLYHVISPEDRRVFEPSLIVYNPNVKIETTDYPAYQFCGIKLRAFFKKVAFATPYDLASEFADGITSKFSGSIPSKLSKDVKRANKESKYFDQCKRGILKFGKCFVEEEDSEPDTVKRCIRKTREEKPIRVITEEEQMNEEMKAKSRRAKREVDGLMKMGISQYLLENILFGTPKLSQLLVTTGNRLILSDYKNLEIKMTPFNKAIYLFFLRHEEGVRFKELIDYKDELIELYKRTKAPFFSLKAKESVNKLVELPEGRDNNRIHEEVSKINAVIKMIVDERIAKYYCIDGEIGEEKKIILPRNLVIWE